MKSVPPSKQLVSLPLDTLVDELLGGQSDIAISKSVAEILFLVTKNKHTCYVQFPSDEHVDLYGAPLLQPKLWRYNHWLSATERWQRQRAISEKLRQEREVERHNHRIVTRALLKKWPLPPDAASMIALTFVRQNQTEKLQAINCPKLATTYQEIQ